MKRHRIYNKEGQLIASTSKDDLKEFKVMLLDDLQSKNYYEALMLKDYGKVEQ